MRVLFLNDVGYQYGAGVAHLRQIQSFLRDGHEVGAFCCHQGEEEERVAFTAGPPDGWRGMRAFPELHWEQQADPAAVSAALVRAASAFAPDLVVVGNLHGARWPVSVVGDLRDAGLRVVAFMHDASFATGRCAYPGDCSLYETGCDATCPTADEYPALPPKRIAPAWQERRRALCGSPAVAVAVNSRWTLELARRALPDTRSDVVYYGLDERVFRPLDRGLARRVLGVPADAFVVATGAVNLGDQRKGGHLLRRVMAEAGGHTHFLLFGHAPPDVPGVQATGFLRDFRKMAFVYSAADVFLGASLQEAFGQTFCEASACGVPVLALRAGGVPEIARDGVNALLVEPGDPDGLRDALERLRGDAELRRTLGRGGRALVEAEFTLEAQARRWRAFVEAFPTGSLS